MRLDGQKSHNFGRITVYIDINTIILPSVYIHADCAAAEEVYKKMKTNDAS
jgi:hypothetical protein